MDHTSKTFSAFHSASMRHHVALPRFSQCSSKGFPSLRVLQLPSEKGFPVPVLYSRGLQLASAASLSRPRGASKYTSRSILFSLLVSFPGRSLAPSIGSIVPITFNVRRPYDSERTYNAWCEDARFDWSFSFVSSQPRGQHERSILWPRKWPGQTVRNSLVEPGCGDLYLNQLSCI